MPTNAEDTIEITQATRLITTRDFLHMLSRHRRFILTLTLAIVIITGIVVAMLPNEYTALTTLYVLSKSDETQSQSSMSSDLTASQMLTNDVSGILTSVRVQTDVADAVGLHDLSGYDIDVDSESTTRVVTVSVTGSDAEKATEIANAIADDAADVTSDLTGTDAVSVIDKARMPADPSGPKRFTYVTLAGIAGLLVSVVAVLVMTMADTRLRDDDDARTAISAPVIAHFPDVDGTNVARGHIIRRYRNNDSDERIDPDKYAMLSNDPYVQNAAHTLLANLAFMSVDDPYKVVSVTSTVPGEGKTFVAGMLARTMARSGKSCCLLECDMYHRTLGASLGVHTSHGLYSVISGQTSLDEALTNIDEGGMLSFLDAEPHIPNPTDVISSERFANLVDTLRERFDYVIVDTPPMSAFADAAVLSPMTDATIFVVRYGCVDAGAANKVVNMLAASGANICGVVMNMCEEQAANTRYGSYYYHTGNGDKIDAKLAKGKDNPFGNLRGKLGARHDNEGKQEIGSHDTTDGSD